MLPSRIEIFSLDLDFNDRYLKRLVNDEGQATAFRVQLKIFTTFVFKLVFRVSGRRVP